MVVVERRPGRTLALALGVVLVVGGAFALGVMWGQRGSGGASAAELEALHTELSAVEERALTAERALADRELAEVVDGDATEQLRQTIKDMGDRQAEIEEEVRFYRQLMAPSEAQRGLRVEKLDLIEGDEGPRVVEYRLLLTQVVDRHDWIRGEVSFDVIGSTRGTQQVLSLTELSKPEAYPLPFRFRYFQDFTGTLELPADFEAERVVVTAAASGRDGKQVQKTFGWAPQRG